MLFVAVIFLLFAFFLLSFRLEWILFVQLFQLFLFLLGLHSFGFALLSINFIHKIRKRSTLIPFQLKLIRVSRGKFRDFHRMIMNKINRVKRRFVMYFHILFRLRIFISNAHIHIDGIESTKRTIPVRISDEFAFGCIKLLRIRWSQNWINFKIVEWTPLLLYLFTKNPQFHCILCRYWKQQNKNVRSSYSYKVIKRGLDE